MKLRIRPKHPNGTPFIIFIVFLSTFIISRLFTTVFPNTSLTIGDVHVHHFAYGIIILSLTGYMAIVRTLTYKNRLRLSVVFGFGLGLAFDEFAMWLQLEDIYQARQNYDAVLITSLLLLSLAYFRDFWKRWGQRLDKLMHIIFITGPKSLFRLAASLFS